MSDSGGEEALKVMENEYIDLVILDIMMPNMTGIEICNKIREKIKENSFLTNNFPFEKGLGEDFGKKCKQC